MYKNWFSLPDWCYPMVTAVHCTSS